MQKTRLFMTIPLMGLLGLLVSQQGHAQPITAGGQPAQLDIRPAGEHSIRVTLKPLRFTSDFPYTPALAIREYPAPAISLRTMGQPLKKRVGNLQVEVNFDPLAITISNLENEVIQQVAFNENGDLSFRLDDQPVLGMGEGGPMPDRGVDWRKLPIEYDRRGRFHQMLPRWQSNAYGSRNPVAMLIGTKGWGLFVATPWVQVDLQNKDRGLFIPFDPHGEARTQQDQKNQGLNQGKGMPPAAQVVPGVYDFFVFDAHDPVSFMKDVSTISGPAVLPPKWALGYMQSHRTLEDESQLIGIVDSFRKKQIPVDAVIYLGTGFCPQGWNTEQPSFDFNPAVFKRDPQMVLSDLHDRQVRVVVHMVPWDRDKLPTLHGAIPSRPGETMDVSHIKNYWQQHIGLVNAGVDGWWPDEGDWFNLFERIKRHQLYYQGPISSQPNLRPWSLHRNGHLGIAQWGGWVWSGDTQSSWKTLEGQIAVGINHSLSLSPFWGSDIGGFYPNPEYTGELYARWFQFGAFCPSFRSHGRTWWSHLPWGWGLGEMGPREVNRSNDFSIEGAARNVPLESELNNPTIEPICRKYATLRYQLMPYTYTLAWESRQTGLPMMRSMWLHYPADERVSGIGDQYLWGRDLLVAPVYEKGATSRELYLPEGLWYDWWTNAGVKGGQTIRREVDLSTMPIYVRAGAIIPFDPVRQYTDEVVESPMTIRIYSGADGHFSLYEDDGISLDYLSGESDLTHFTWTDRTKKLSIESTGQGDKPRQLRIELLPEGTVININYSGKVIELGFE
ncbi:MAG: glycoside hydrolase family 31 protein [Saprospiraceae bacterium]